MNRNCLNDCQAYFNISLAGVEYLYSEGCVEQNYYDPATGDFYDIWFNTGVWCSILSLTDSILNYGYLCQDYCTVNETFNSSEIEGEGFLGLSQNQLMVLGGLAIIIFAMKK